MALIGKWLIFLPQSRRVALNLLYEWYILPVDDLQWLDLKMGHLKRNPSNIR